MYEGTLTQNFLKIGNFIPVASVCSTSWIVPHSKLVPSTLECTTTDLPTMDRDPESVRLPVESITLISLCGISGPNFPARSPASHLPTGEVKEQCTRDSSTKYNSVTLCTTSVVSQMLAHLIQVG